MLAQDDYSFISTGIASNKFSKIFVTWKTWILLPALLLTINLYNLKEIELPVKVSACFVEIFPIVNHVCFFFFFFLKDYIEVVRNIILVN